MKQLNWVGAVGVLLASVVVIMSSGILVAGEGEGGGAGGDEPVLLRATLTANDFLTHTVSFDTGDPGSAMCGREVCNQDGDLDFGVRRPNGFTVGIQGSKRGAIIDCGHWRDLAIEYGYDETVGGGQGFSSIRFEQGELVILADRDSQTVQPFTKGNEFLELETPASDDAAGRIGHVYLVHLVDDDDPGAERVVKFLVVSGRRNDRATIVWEVLER